MLRGSPCKYTGARPPKEGARGAHCRFRPVGMKPPGILRIEMDRYRSEGAGIELSAPHSNGRRARPRRHRADSAFNLSPPEESHSSFRSHETTHPPLITHEIEAGPQGRGHALAPRDGPGYKPG